MFAVGAFVRVFRRNTLSYPIKDFCVRPARSRRACRPPVIACRQIGNSALRHSVFFPIRRGILVARRISVACKDRNRKHTRVKSEPFGSRQKFITKCNRFLFKIIAERPVAEHFKTRQMTCVSYFVNIAGADTFLIVSKARSRRMRFAEQVRYQRMHSRRRKKD